MGNFSDLPGEIVLDIFTRLPTESVLDCKSVSKTWRNLLHNPAFHQIHSNLLLGNHDYAANHGKLSFIFRMNRQLHYFEYDDDEVSSHRIQKLIFDPPFQINGIVGSCNGLICMNVYTVSYVCNPITRECITLPELDTSTYCEPVNFMLSGFGYVVSTNEYEVVRLYIFWRERENKYAQIEVYTLGSGKGWRNAGKINIDSDSICRQNAVFVDGFLYWNFRNRKTMAFDLADEIFVEISKFTMGNVWMGVLGGGYLCSTQYKDQGTSSDVWLLKKKADESFSWRKEFSLFTGDLYATSLAITSSRKVLCYTDSKLYLYDLQSSSSKMLHDFRATIFQAIPHINTLMSPKAFGEENTTTLEAGGSNRNSNRSPKRKNR